MLRLRIHLDVAHPVARLPARRVAKRNEKRFRLDDLGVDDESVERQRPSEQREPEYAVIEVSLLQSAAGQHFHSSGLGGANEHGPDAVAGIRRIETEPVEAEMTRPSGIVD